MYENASAMPIPMFHPIPPRVFREDRATPIMVRMMAEDSRGDLRRTISDLEELLKELRDAVQ